MATDQPCGADGLPLDVPSSSNGWTKWGEAVNRRLAAQRKSVEALAEALRNQLVRERAERVKLAGEVEALRAELSTQRALADLAARLDRLEGAGKVEVLPPLRVVSSP
jgi:chromosome segregation ATPase